jgi:hypothetical protein
MSNPRRSYWIVPSVNTLGFTMLSWRCVHGRVASDCTDISRTLVLDIATSFVESAADPCAADDPDPNCTHKSRSGMKAYHASEPEATSAVVTVGGEFRAGTDPGDDLGRLLDA